MQFIELTLLSGKNIYVNANMISSVRPKTHDVRNKKNPLESDFIDGTEITVANDDDVWNILEDYLTVKSKIDAACQASFISYAYSGPDDMKAVRQDCGLQS